MSKVIAHIKPNSIMPKRFVGATTADKKTGVVTIETKEPGKVKTTSKAFNGSDIIAYKAGDAGFVLVMSTDAIISLVGDLVTDSDGNPALKTAEGNIRMNAKIPGVTIEYQPVEEDSREARAAERGSAVKVRGARAAKAAPAATGRRAKTAAAPTGKKAAAAEEAPRRSRAERRAAAEKAAPAKKARR